MKVDVLFVCRTGAEGALVAAAALKCFSKDKVSSYAACVESTSINRGLLKEAEGRYGLTEVPDLLPMGEVSLREFDLVVCLCDRPQDMLMRLPGNPPYLSWNICNSARCTEEHLAQIVQRTRDLWEHGYLHAMVTAKRQSERVLESLQEGLIAHDLNRRIFLFNRAAERITGYSREEVLGRDCHEVFPGKFCGEKCSFCNVGHMDQCSLRAEYSVSLTSRSGQRHVINMRILPIEGEDGQVEGVVASFRDVTEELRLKRRLVASGSFYGMIGKDPVMQDLYGAIEDVAKSNVPVLVLGESGTGKEVVASLIHRLSPRRRRLFVPVNCGAIPEQLIESELFGHEKGAFTGAVREKRGRFELANGGTLFLDEIGDLPLAMQVKLLRVLQDGSFVRVGGEKEIHVDVRIVAATNQDLERAVDEGRFRQDLFYRICVFPLTVPPLRERKSDVPLLANHFLATALEASGRDSLDVAISSEAMGILMSYNWPGNVRELQNAIQYSLLRCKGRFILPEHLPAQLLGQRGMRRINVMEMNDDVQVKRRGRRPKDLTVEGVEKALQEASGNRTAAAKILGVSRATLYRFLQKNRGLMDKE